MFDAFVNIFLNIFNRWTDRPVVRISVKRLKYELIRNDPDSIVVLITTCPSRYYAKVGFSHRGKATTIKNLTLIIDQGLRLKAEGFSPLKLENGDYSEAVVVFPVEGKLAVTDRTFEI